MITVKVLKSILKVLHVSDGEGAIQFVITDKNGNKISYFIESVNYGINDEDDVCSITLNLKEE